MQTSTPLQPTSVTEKAKYYSFEAGTLTHEILQHLIPESLYQFYKIEFYTCESSNKDKIVITTQEGLDTRNSISLNSIRQLKVQEGVCFSISSIYFDITIYENFSYVSVIIF